MLSLFAASLLALPARPKLVVVLSIDQFRADYLYRFEKQYLPAYQDGKIGGFRYLTEKGANFVNARYHHIPTHTGPGHSVIMSGSTPGIDGIVGNNWYNRASGKMVYCVQDDSTKDILTGKPSMSPRNLRVSTVGDELKLATADRCTNISIALKDRAAILLAGHAPNSVVWFDRKSGGWTTSDYYVHDGNLPGWVQKVNARHLPDAWKGKDWVQSLPAEAYQNVMPSPHSKAPAGFGDAFPHHLPEKNFYDLFTNTPMANEYVIDTAISAVEDLNMGNHDVPDVLTMNFSPNDYIGHMYGPHSPEAEEMCLGTDRAISKLLNVLNQKVSGGLKNVLFVLTADHGVEAVPEDYVNRGIPGARLGEEWEKSLHEKLAAKLGVDPIANIDDGMVWFDRTKLTGNLSAAQNALAQILRADPNVYLAVPSVNVQGMANNDPVFLAIRRNYDPERSADVYFALHPGIYQGGGFGTSHGTAWAYDTTVPLIFAGPGILPGRHLETAGPEDIAATLSVLLGIVPPSGSIGQAIGLKP